MYYLTPSSFPAILVSTSVYQYNAVGLTEWFWAWNQNLCITLSGTFSWVAELLKYSWLNSSPLVLGCVSSLHALFQEESTGLGEWGRKTLLRGGQPHWFWCDTYCNQMTFMFLIWLWLELLPLKRVLLVSGTPWWNLNLAVTLYRFQV